MLSARPPARSGPIASWRHADHPLIVAIVALASFGTLIVFSATRHRLARSWPRRAVGPQKAGAVRCRRHRGDGAHRRSSTTATCGPLAPYLFAGTVFLLLAVIPLGTNVKGTQARFDLGPFQFQPSEWAKVGDRRLCGRVLRHVSRTVNRRPDHRHAALVGGAYRVDLPPARPRYRARVHGDPPGRAGRGRGAGRGTWPSWPGLR